MYVCSSVSYLLLICALTLTVLLLASVPSSGARLSRSLNTVSCIVRDRYVTLEITVRILWNLQKLVNYF